MVGLNTFQQVSFIGSNALLSTAISNAVTGFNASIATVQASAKYFQGFYIQNGHVSVSNDGTNFIVTVSCMCVYQSAT